MPINLVQYKEMVGVFNNYIFHGTTQTAYLWLIFAKLVNFLDWFHYDLLLQI